MNSELDYPTKLSIFISSLLMQSNLLSHMSTSQKDETIFTLLKNSNLKTTNLASSREAIKHLQPHDTVFCIAESLIVKRLAQSLEFYFSEVDDHPKKRQIIAQQLQRILSSAVADDDYHILCVLLEHMPSLNISFGNTSILSLLTELNISNAKLAHLFDICRQNPQFDPYFQNSDGSYFYERYINNIAMTHPKKLEERASFISYLLNIKEIREAIITCIENSPNEALFDRVLVHYRLEQSLEQKPAQILVKI